MIVQNLSIFTSSFNEIKTQFGQVMNILKSDNAKEYFSSEFLRYFELNGILQQSHLSSYTSTQLYSREKDCSKLLSIFTSFLNEIKNNLDKL